MKKYLCFLVLVPLFSLLIAGAVVVMESSPARAYFLTSYLTEGLILSDNLPAGQMLFSANIEYFSASETVDSSSSPPKWVSLSDGGINSVTWMAVPLKFSHGINDFFSYRITLPYVSRTFDFKVGNDLSESGVGDARIEVLLKAVEEGGGSPSLAFNVGAKLATGTKLDGAKNKPGTGSGATDVYLSGILQKSFGAVVGKALLGYIVTGGYEFKTGGIPEKISVTPPDAIIYSIQCAIPSDQFEFGGEIWGISASGKERYSASGMTSFDVPHSSINNINLSPYVIFKPSPDLSIKGVIDVPLSQQASNAISYGFTNVFKGYNIIVGAEWAL